MQNIFSIVDIFLAVSTAILIYLYAQMKLDRRMRDLETILEEKKTILDSKIAHAETLQHEHSLLLKLKSNGFL